MGFSGIDDLVLQSTTNGKSLTLPFMRTIQAGATSVAGRFHECFTSSGSGGSGVLTGTSGQGQAYTNSSAGSLKLNASVSPATRHIQRMQAVTSSAVVAPGVLKLIDILYAYPGCTTLTTPTTLAQTAAKPSRMTANYKGVKCMAIVTGAIGAAVPLLTLTYLDQDGNSQTGILATSAASMPVGSCFSNAGASLLGGPDMLFSAGVTGIQQITSYAITSGSIAGTVSFVLYREIASIPLIGANIASEKDFTFELPQFDDAACLTFLAQIGAAMTVSQNIMGEIRTVWGG